LKSHVIILSLYLIHIHHMNKVGEIMVFKVCAPYK
jgi:hypothetical protein